MTMSETLHPARDLQSFTDAEAAVARIGEIYERSAEEIRARFAAFAKGKRAGHPTTGACYPYLGLGVGAESLVYDSRPSWGTLAYPGVYGTTLTRPDLFRDYYRAQIARLIDYHGVAVEVGISERRIPLPFVIEEATTDIGPEDVRALGAVFALPSLAHVDDAVANGTHRTAPGGAQPLALFSAERVDLALQRLVHYTATSPEHFQRFVLFTNYQRYVDEFTELGRRLVAEGGGEEGYARFVEPGDLVQERGAAPSPQALAHRSLPQMPAHHLVREDRLGVTLVNIGVGPSNAKTITDHLAVLRPHC